MTNGLESADILRIAGDALYNDDRVRWVIDSQADGLPHVVLTDGREFVLSVEVVAAGGAS